MSLNSFVISSKIIFFDIDNIFLQKAVELYPSEILYMINCIPKSYNN